MLSDKLAAALGTRFHDVRATLKTHETARFGPMDARRCQYIALHHATGQRTVTAEAIARYHVGRGWAGIGYHFVVRLGQVHYVGDVNTMRAHVQGRNDEALGICVTGEYSTAVIAPEDLQALRDLVRVLDTHFGHAKELIGHGQLLVDHTTCPGRLVEAIPLLRGPVAPWTREDARKAAWYEEQLAGALRGDATARDALIGALRTEPARPGAHNLLVAVALPPLYKERDK